MSGRINNAKWCFVPTCLNSAKNSPHKWFVPVPKEENRRASWFNAVNREYTPGNNNATPLFCCSDHFDEKEDTESCIDPSGQQRTRLKHTVVPKLIKPVQVAKLLTPEKLITSKLEPSKISGPTIVDSSVPVKDTSTKGKEKFTQGEIDQFIALKKVIPSLEKSSDTVPYGTILKEAEHFVQQMILKTSKRESSINFAKKNNTTLRDKITKLEKLEKEVLSGEVIPTREMLKEFNAVGEEESPRRRVAIRGRRRAFGKRRSLP